MYRSAATGLSLVLCFIFHLAAARAANAQNGPLPIRVELGGIGHELSFDRVNERLYVSVPSLGEIVAISVHDFSIVQRFNVGSQPRGIDVSSDGGEVFAALNGAGSVAVVDVAAGTTIRINVGSELDDPRTWDVVEGEPGRLFVSSNPGSNGFAYIVEILLDSGGAAKRVASDRIIRAAPVFAIGPNERFLYVGSGFSPNSLFKLDLSLVDAPIILEDNHGSVGGTNALAVSPDGTRIHLGSGQVLRTGSFVDEDQLVAGIARYGDTPGIVYVAEFGPFGSSSSSTTVRAYDTSTYLEVESFTLPCAPAASFSRPADFLVLPEDAGFLILADDLLCGIVSEGSVIDDDSDGVVNGQDNCPDLANPDQLNRDADEFGDACDPFPDAADNLSVCLDLSIQDREQITLLQEANMAQADHIDSLSGELEACFEGSADADNDGVPDDADRCAETPFGEVVNLDGCARKEFCSTIEIKRFRDVIECARASWRSTSDSYEGRRKGRGDCRIVWKRNPRWSLSCQAR